MDTLATVQGYAWLPRKSEGLTKNAAYAILARGAQPFLVRLQLQDIAPPLCATFSLEPLDVRTVARKVTLKFSWAHSNGFSLPSMRGEFLTRRVGPFVRLSVRANYTFDDGPAGRLFHETIGERLRRSAFKVVMGAIKRLVLESNEQPLVAQEETRQVPRRHV